MGQLSPVLVPLLVGILFGAATISIAAWLILRSRIKAATRETGEARVEMATLSERARRLTEIESQLAECGLRLREETGKVATLTEQNTRLPELQQLVESRGNEIQRLSDEAAGLRTKFVVSESIAQSRLQQNERLDAELAEAKGKIEGFATEQAQLKAEVARLTTSLQAELSNTDEKIALLTEVKGKFSNEFEILASSILEDKSKRFTAQNETNLGLLLGPLATKLQEFQKQVGDVYGSREQGIESRKCDADSNCQNTVQYRRTKRESQSNSNFPEVNAQP
jgi:DNA recombination protein RmuC